MLLSVLLYPILGRYRAELVSEMEAVEALLSPILKRNGSTASASGSSLHLDEHSSE